MRPWNLILFLLTGLLLAACQLQQPFIAADVIIEDAHGGGSALEFNQQETLLASGGWEGFIRLWELPSGSKHFAWKAHQDEVTGIKFFANDSRIVSSGHDGWLKIWSGRGKLIKAQQSQSPIRSMTLDENSALIITGHVDGTIRKWHLPELGLIDARKQHHSAVRAVEVYPASGLIASSASRGDTVLWSSRDESIELPSTPSDIRSLAFAGQGQFLLGGGWFHLYRWNLADKSLQVLKTEHQGIIRTIEMLPDGETLASISRQTDSAVLFLDPLSGEVRQRFQPHDLCGVDVTVSSSQKYLASTSDDASVRIWWLQREKSDH